MTIGRLGRIEHTLASFFQALRERVQGTHPNTNILHPQWIMDRHLLKFSKTQLNGLEPNSTILDVGCGNGPYWSLKTDLNWHGIDTYSNKNTTYAVRPDGTYPIMDDIYDYAFCTQVFEHVDNLEVAVNEIYRVLKPGGKLILNTPFLYPFHGMPHDFARFTSSGLQKLFKKFNIIEAGEIGSLGSAIGTIINNFWNYTTVINWKTRVLGLILWPISLFFNLFWNLLSFPLDYLDRTKSFPLNVYLIAAKPE